jgi:glycosyltransferase involved in cell wall biosynthesis
MKILFLISSEGFYGVENMLVTLARQLADEGCSCVVGVFSNSHYTHVEIAEKAKDVGLCVEIISCTGRWDKSAARSIRALIQKHDIDILHTHGYKADLYGYAATRKLRVTLMATSHNWTGKTVLMRLYEGLDRLVLRRFQHVVVVSEEVGVKLRRWGVPAKRVSIIRNGVNLKRYQEPIACLRRELGVDGRQVVGFVGRLVEDKGGAQFIRAACNVLESWPDAKFVLVGGGPSRADWEALARRHGIANAVYFTGAREDMPAVYASFDILVLPSLLEAFPMCLLEGMAVGKPVIASRVGDVPKLIEHESTGLLVEPGDVHGLAREIVRLLGDPVLAKKIAENGRSHVKKHFSSGQMAKNYLKKYQELIGIPDHRALPHVACETN